MRMSAHKKETLTYYEPDNLDWVTGEIGPPPFDVSGVAYLLKGLDSFDSKYSLESTRRTLEAMVRDGLLEKITSYEQRQDTTQSGDGKGVWCNCSRYGLAGTVTVVRDTGGKREAIEGEVVRID
ncbi:TPA: hypothetical protein PXN30_003328 [Yersinia enterocolitica]|uniref:hypothetical protein n=1 Tax=Yersinia enterocolitica TaxID=630 RepID=UPI0005E375F2|nr:hypothetical protein [Yersinia enterocolitica]AKF36930.1 hypothetical protein FORC2_0783 [Yersinia enterocolitica]ALG46471.1 hypothetical protein LI89_17645 [Yersinia enterocolitica]EKN4074856.1 hypothetical protein [Yersinia enterocolitica]EKN4144584.1 hypothetical protein [Yersinia enterocolitica]EKN6345978.1 hypothetical protein [Yersinia enterocolitica]